ncbi:MAG: hypothetical protein HY748_08420 [Elusimicrobia bacterium]|nr:hypothetical protein [Elusimicrobiota bacterium]
MAFSQRSLERADAVLKKLADALPKACRAPVERVRKALDPIRQREALIGKFRAKIARYEAQIAEFKTELDHEHSELIAARMKASEAEELAAQSRKAAFDAVRSQSEREETANQAASVLTQELKTALANVSASLKIAAEETRLRKDGESIAKELEMARYQLGKAADLIENLRFYLRD